MTDPYDYPQDTDDHDPSEPDECLTDYDPNPDPPGEPPDGEGYPAMASSSNLVGVNLDHPDDDIVIKGTPKPWYGEGYGNEKVNRAIYENNLDLGQEWSEDDTVRLIQAILDQAGFCVRDARKIGEKIRDLWPKHRR